VLYTTTVSALLSGLIAFLPSFCSHHDQHTTMRTTPAFCAHGQHAGETGDGRLLSDEREMISRAPWAEHDEALPQFCQVAMDLSLMTRKSHGDGPRSPIVVILSLLSGLIAILPSFRVSLACSTFVYYYTFANVFFSLH
jgi:hypothetical protein